MHNKNKKFGPASQPRDSRTGGPFCRRYVSTAIHRALTLLLLSSPFALSEDSSLALDSENAFVIAVSKNGNYLCGEGITKIQGCIVEARRQGAKKVVITASHKASHAAVVALLDAVQSAGFEDIGLSTISDDNT